jgi:hypothetical protein
MGAAGSQPPYLLTFLHPRVHRESNYSFGDRDAHDTARLIDQPAELSDPIAIQQVQSGSQLSRWCQGFWLTDIGLIMTYDRLDAIDADP